MKYFIKMLNGEKTGIKMNNQSDSGFDLIFLNDDIYHQIMDRVYDSMKRKIEVNLAWELKDSKKSYKVYKNVEIISEVRDNINPFSKKVQGKSVSFSCVDVEYYSNSRIEVGLRVPRTSRKYKDSKTLERALKISNLNFDLK